MRRVLAGAIAFFALLGTILVLPVYAAPSPEPEPVEVEAEQVGLGSVAEPAQAAEVQEGTTEPVAGVSETAPALTVTRTDVGEFSMVNVNWAYDPAVTDTVVQVRVQDTAGEWGEWTAVETEDAEPEAGGGAAEGRRGSTSPLWTGPSSGVEVELVTRSGAAPTDVQLDLIDPGTSAADTSLGTPDIQDTADAAMAMPDVYSRAQWGADERLRTWGPEYAPTIRAATVHHTASSSNYSAADVPAILRGIYYSHAVSNRWGDVGYNVLVDKFGRLWEGRSGGLASTVIGAHAGGFNTGTFGVSMIGNYDVTETTQPMVDAVSAIIAWKFSLFGVDPRGSTTLVSGGGGTSRYPAGVQVTVPTIFGHRDVGATACPGRYGYSRMGEIRDKAAARISGALSGIESYYQGNAAARAALGTAVGSERAVGDGGWSQEYQFGAVYWSPATGAHAVYGSIRDRWAAAGATSGALGYPAGEMACGLSGGGCRQEFRGGALYWSPPSGTHPVYGAIKDAWQAARGIDGYLGYPMGDMGCGLVRGGCEQAFQGGIVLWSPASGGQGLSGAIGDTWMARGGKGGPLGYPTSAMACGLVRSGCSQDFEGGTLVWSGATGTQALFGAIRDGWLAAGGPRGTVGYPAGDMACGLLRDGCRQPFESGWLYWSPSTGTHAVGGDVLAGWTTSGGHEGWLGYPAAVQTCDTSATSCWQRFEGGTVSWSDEAGTHTTSGAIAALWSAQRGPAGALGHPAAEMECGLVRGGCLQEFEGGVVTWSPAAGTQTVAGDIAARWDRDGGVDGFLGYPTGAAVCGLRDGGCRQSFEGGMVSRTAATGAVATSGAIHWLWLERGAESDVLGYPVDAMTCGLRDGGCRQDFQGGAVLWSAATGTGFVSGAIGEFWTASGKQDGPLGYPTAAMFCGLPGGGCGQHFQGGSVYWSRATGAQATFGGLRDVWIAQGWERGPLGYPTGAMLCGLPRGGCGQHFQGGTVHWSPASGAWATYGAIRAAWIAQNWERGPLGYPTGAMTCRPADCQQRFEGGILLWTAATGRTQKIT